MKNHQKTLAGIMQDEDTKRRLDSSPETKKLLKGAKTHNVTGFYAGYKAMLGTPISGFVRYNNHWWFVDGPEVYNAVVIMNPNEQGKDTLTALVKQPDSDTAIQVRDAYNEAYRDVHNDRDTERSWRQ